MTQAKKRFSLYVEMDWATMTCPCGSSCQTDMANYHEWKKAHAKHTDDDGKSYLEENDPVSWSKCCSNPCPEPTVKKLQ